MERKRAVVLLSGGVDSSTVLALASREDYKIHALSFRYGQRHEREIEAAKRIVAFFDVQDHRIINFNLRAIGGSALTDQIDVPKGRELEEISRSIPVTYVPARNTIFLSFALSLAEKIEAEDIFFGANQLDYSGYPDCRGEYIRAFEDRKWVAHSIIGTSKASAWPVRSRCRSAASTPSTMNSPEILSTTICGT